MSDTEKKNHDLGFFMSRIHHYGDVKSDKKSDISTVIYDENESICILRRCKGRDLREVFQSLQKIKSPGVCRVYDHIYDGQDTYVIEEKLNGEDLGKVLSEKKTLSEKETARIIIEVCKGLSAMHGMTPPVIHNDIKPDNIMLCEDGGVKLFDFDISRNYREGAEANTTLLGTKEYAAPEHYGFGQSTCRTDIYSLGVTMHKMLSGRVLTVTHEVTYKGKLRKIIEKCTKRDPDDRYASAWLLQKDLEKFLKRKKVIFARMVAVFCAVIVALALGVLAYNSGLFDFFDGNTGIVGQGDKPEGKDEGNKESSDTTDSTKDTAPPKEDMEGVSSSANKAEEKKVNVVKKLEGDLVSMVSKNDGTIVYIEKIADKYYVKDSKEKELVLNLNSKAENYSLLYNSFTDTLYLIENNGYNEKSCIYEIDKSFNVNGTPLYNGKSKDPNSFFGGFFSDGVMISNAFMNELIDSNDWVEIGDASNTVVGVLKDRIFSFGNATDSGWIYEITAEGTELNKLKIPLNQYYCDYYTAGKGIFLIGKSDYGSDNQYIYEFDGEKFVEVICLNDYKYYSEFEFSYFCVTEDRAWVYDKASGSIKEFLFE